MSTNGHNSLEYLTETLDTWARTGETPLVERFSELELQLENAGWIRQQDMYSSTEFSLSGLKTIARLARTFYLKNPLIQRGVNVQTDYTFGRGIVITAKDEQINEVIQSFLNDLKNQVEITSHQSLLQKDRELQLDGNVFLVFFIHEGTGRIRIRSIPFQEIDQIICNPEDRKDPWFYKRIWIEEIDGVPNEHTAFYKDWQYNGTDILGLPEHSEVATGSVYHIKMGGFSDWKFGVSEVYAALDWAKAYKSFLENWATLMQAYARFAMKLNTKGGAAGVQAAKVRMQATPSALPDRNPPAVTGSTWIESDQASLDVVKTAGATAKAEEGRRLLLMVAAAQGLPETFYGDVSVGTLATAESLDRPTELKFSNRQEFWQSTLMRIVWFVIQNAVSAIGGPLKSFASMEPNEYGEDILVIPDDIDKSISIDFPEILGISIKDHISAIISGVTLDGKTRVLLNPKMVTQMILTALGSDDVDAILETLEDEGAFDEPEPEPLVIAPPVFGKATPVAAKPVVAAKTQESLSTVIGRLIEAMNKHE